MAADVDPVTGVPATPGADVDLPPRILMRFRGDVTALLGLPWETPLADWPAGAARFVELPVGESRHVVRFIAGATELLALKELPMRPGRREYEVMRELEDRGTPAVRPVGLVERPDDDAAIIVTRYLARSLQLRRLFRRLPESAGEYRERFLDAMSRLLVELHRDGVYWGDCSLANTLLMRDGQALQAYLVDAETSEVHARLSEGQRRMDIDIAVENVAGDLLDIAATSGRPLDDADEELAAALSLRDRYDRLWTELYAAETIGPDERYRVEARIRRLNALGFVVEEVIVEPGAGGDQARLRVAVGSRRFHAARLQELTGLEVGRGTGDGAAQRPRGVGGVRSGGGHAARHRRSGVAGPWTRCGEPGPAVPRAAASGGPALAHRCLRAHRGAAATGPRRRHRPGPGVLRLPRGQVAAVRAGWPRRGR